MALPSAALAADPSPTAGDDPSPDPSNSAPAGDPPSDPPPDTPPPDTPPPPRSSPAPPQSAPSLSLRLVLSPGRAAPGGSVTATAHVRALRAVAHHAVVRFSASSASVGGPVSLGDLSAGERSATSVVHIPASHGAGSVTVTASLSADRAGARSDTGKITVSSSAADAAAEAAAAAGGVPLAPSLQIPGLPGSGAAVGGGPPQAQLPLISQQPAVAPDELPAVRPVSLRTRTSPLGLDPISYRLLWTQVAWLAALLVGISLLLTQLRINRRRVPVRPAGRRGPRRS
ncbi:hypothetical protein [Actinomadura sp. DC4]|uniref:hypothetical protein n=1 Tax=Actinomadura sp. DC4 TaxID=3055069 RepID=UPI0025B237C6|nr:hypothetical protein [Actinomadura sp. DC4]MDN3357855.1 hypothetical protein [Actinomadura sp. DC4]